MPKLSIITINLNNVQGLLRTLESVINQKFVDYEFIIIDGGSTDGSIDFLKNNSNKISYWVSEPDTGIYNAMNKGIMRSKGKYLLFLNSGDWLINENVLSRLFQQELISDIIYGDTNFVDGEKLTIRRGCKVSELKLSYFFNNSLCHPATLISKNLFTQGLYDETYKIAADKKFFIEKIIVQNCSVEYVDEVISCFNINGISNLPENRSIIIDENERIIKELFHPRMIIDILNFKEHYFDFKAVTVIKQNKGLYSAFKVLKRSTTLFKIITPRLK